MGIVLVMLITFTITKCQTESFSAAKTKALNSIDTCFYKRLGPQEEKNIQKDGDFS